MTEQARVQLTKRATGQPLLSKVAPIVAPSPSVLKKAVGGQGEKLLPSALCPLSWKAGALVSSQGDARLGRRRDDRPARRSVVKTTVPDLDRTGGSILKLRPQDSDRRAVDKLKILLEVSKQLASPEQPERLLEKILELLFEIMNVDRAAILMVNQATGQLECKAVKLQAGISAQEHFYSSKIANFVCEHGKAVLTADAFNDQRFNRSESIIAQAIHASICVPLKPREAVIGVLYVDNLSSSNLYSDEDLEFLAALANQAAIAIDNSQLYKKMQAEAVMRSKLERFFPQAVSKKLREEGSDLEIVETEVTALFSDISGFTKMSSTMEPRQVIEMLNEYFQVMVEEIVFRYQGTLEKYIGDSLFAIWGAPYQKADDSDQKADDPAQALQAAIEMQWAVQRLNQKWVRQGKQPIQIHIGINTGKVAAGNIGSKKLIQYATIGDTTNVTSRICNIAQAGEIVVSHSTYERLKALDLPWEKMPPIRVKGKEQPLQLYRLLWKQCAHSTESPQASTLEESKIKIAKTAPALNREFLERCQRQLARCIGPFASFIIEHILAEYPQVSPQQHPVQCVGRNLFAYPDHSQVECARLLH